jgi:hypothetical protein
MSREVTVMPAELFDALVDNLDTADPLPLAAELARQQRPYSYG